MKIRLQRLARTAALLAVAGGGLAARAQTSVNQDLIDFATYARNYNLITTGSATFNSSSDTEGAIAIGGNLTVGGSYTFATQAGASGGDPTFYVAGTLALSGSSQLNNGYASTPGASGSWNGTQKVLTVGSGSLGMNSSDPNAANNPINNPAPSNWSWSTESGKFSSISSDLAAATTNGTVGVSGQNLTFSTSVTSGVAIFDLNAALLSGNSYNGQTISSIQISVPAGVTYLINVLNLSNNQTLFGSGVNFNGSSASQILWNFAGTGTVNISNGGYFYGSVLAPGMTLNDSTTIDGQVVASSFTDNGVELHYADFTAPAAVLAPEPMAWAWAAVALCAAALAGRRYLPGLTPAASRVSK